MEKEYNGNLTAACYAVATKFTDCFGCMPPTNASSAPVAAPVAAPSAAPVQTPGMMGAYSPSAAPVQTPGMLGAYR